MKIFAFLLFLKLALLLSATLQNTTSSAPARSQLEVAWDKVFLNLDKFTSFPKLPSFSWLYDLYLFQTLKEANKVLILYHTDQLICKAFDIAGRSAVRRYQCEDVPSPVSVNCVYEKTDLDKFRFRALAAQISTSHLPTFLGDLIKDLCAYQILTANEMKMMEPPTEIQTQRNMKSEANFETLLDFRKFLVSSMRNFDLNTLLRQGINGAMIVRAVLNPSIKWEQLKNNKCIDVNLAALYIVEKQSHLLTDGLISYHMRYRARRLFCSTSMTVISQNLLEMTNVKKSINQAFPTTEDKLVRIREMLLEKTGSSRPIEINMKSTNSQLPMFMTLLCYANYMINRHEDTMVGETVLLERIHMNLMKIQKLYFQMEISDNCFQRNITVKSFYPGILTNRFKALTAIYGALPPVRTSLPEASVMMEWIPFYAELSLLLHSLLNQYMVYHGPTVDYDLRFEAAFDALTDLQLSWSKFNMEGNFKRANEFLEKQLRLEPSSEVKLELVEADLEMKEDIGAIVAMIEEPIKPSKQPKVEPMLRDEEFKWETESDESLENVSKDELETESEDEDQDGVVLPIRTMGTSTTAKAATTTNTKTTTTTTSMMAPVHIRALIDAEDRTATQSLDPRDVAYAYLMIGNEIYIRYLSPLLESLKQQSIPLHTLFTSSLQKFQSEIQLLAEIRPNVMENAFGDAGIEGMEFLADCVKFYEKRLKVAHPYISSDVQIKRWMLRMYVSQLYRASHSKYGSGLNIIEQDTSGILQKVKEYAYFEPLNSCLPDEIPDDIDFELAVMALAKLVPRSGLNSIRCEIAHSRPTPEILYTLIENVFADSPHIHFLRIAFPY